MGIGFSIAASIGLAIGFVMGLSRVVNGCLRSLFLERTLARWGLAPRSSS